MRHLALAALCACASYSKVSVTEINVRTPIPPPEGETVGMVVYLGACIDSATKSCIGGGPDDIQDATESNGDPWVDSTGKAYARCARRRFDQDGAPGKYAYILEMWFEASSENWPLAWPSHVSCATSLGGDSFRLDVPVTDLDGGPGW